MNGEAYKETEYYQQHKEKTYTFEEYKRDQREYLKEEVSGTFILYGTFTELPDEIRLQPLCEETKIERQGDLLHMTYKGIEKAFDLAYELPDTTWNIQSFQIGEQLFLPRQENQSDANGYSEQYTGSLYVYGIQNLQDLLKMNITMENAEVKTSISMDEVNDRGDSVARIKMEYQGQKKDVYVYNGQNSLLFPIKEITAGDWTYRPGYISNMETSGDSESDIDKKGIFSQNSYNDTIELSGMARTFGEEVQFTMVDPDVAVKVEASDRDYAEKKVTFSKGELKKIYYIHYQPDANVWKFSQVKAGTTSFAWNSDEDNYAEEPYFTTTRHYHGSEKSNLNELLVYGTEKELDADFTVTPEKAGVEATVSDTDRNGYAKKIDLTYGRYHKTYFVKYDALPSVWKLDSIQTKEASYRSNWNEEDGYFYQYSNELTLYGKEKDIPEITQVTTENPEVTAEVSGTKILLHYGTLQKEISVTYKPMDSIWNLKTVQDGAQIYEKSQSEDCYYQISSRYFNGQEYSLLSLYGLDKQIGEDWKLEAENPEVTVQIEATDPMSDLEAFVQKKVTLTYGSFTQIYYVTYERSNHVCDLVQIKDGTEVYGKRDYDAEEKQDIYFNTGYFYDPEDTNDRTTKESIMVYGYKESLASDLNIVCKGTDAVAAVEDCQIEDKSYAYEENPRIFTKKITVECAGKTVIYYVCYQLVPDFWNIKEIRDEDTVYSTEESAKNSFRQNQEDAILYLYGEKEAPGKNLSVVFKSAEQHPDIQITSDYADGVLALHYGRITKIYQVAYQQIKNEEDMDW